MNCVRQIGCVCLTVFVAFSISACGMPGSSNRTDSLSEGTAEETPETSVTLWVTKELVTYDSLEKLLEVSDLVFIGTVTETMPAVYLNQSDTDLRTDEFSQYFNLTPSKVRVDQVLIGDISVGDVLRIDQEGGHANSINEIVENVTYVASGKTYLMFVKYTESDNKDQYLTYRFASCLDGFMEIDDGKLNPLAGSVIFSKGTAIEDAVQMIHP